MTYLLAAKQHLTNNKELQYKHLCAFMEHFVITQDEHDEDNPFKKMPVNEMPHIFAIAREWVYKQRIVIAKSRQLMVTWIFCTFLLWDAMFKDGRLNIIISKKETDANDTLDRLKTIYSNLPEAVKNRIVAHRNPRGDLGSFCRMDFPANNSKILALSSNPDQIRSKTASNIFFDEMAFFERAEECYVAAMPSIRGGGSIACVSTPNGRNFFYKLFNDKMHS